jgi:hypothetical protein
MNPRWEDLSDRFERESPAELDVGCPEETA